VTEKTKLTLAAKGDGRDWEAEVEQLGLQVAALQQALAQEKAGRLQIFMLLNAVLAAAGNTVLLPKSLLDQMSKDDKVQQKVNEQLQAIALIREPATPPSRLIVVRKGL
jgi:hypothetical protein